MFGLPSFLLPLIGAVVVAAGGFYAGLRWDDGVIQRMKAHDAQMALQAQQQADKITKDDAALAQANGEKDAAIQQAMATHAQVVRSETTKYVTDTVTNTVGCVDWGLLRVHDAAVLGVDPSTLQPPAGQSDDACSPVKPSDFAAAVAGNYAIANENAQQLNDLEADIRQRVAVFNQVRGGK